MKKILAILGGLTFLTSSTTSIVACKNENKEKESSEIEKLDINAENLTKYFTENNTWTYKGEFFFKDKSDQEGEDLEKIRKHGFDNLLEYLISDLIKPKFIETFNYNPLDNFINIVNNNTGTFDITGIQLNKNYELNFALIFSESETSPIFTRIENLKLNFIETKMYEKQIWLKKFTDYYMKYNNLLWSGYYSHENYIFSAERVMDASTDKNDKNYSTDNLKDSKEFMSKYISDNFQREGEEGKLDGYWWFYKDYKINAVVNNYKFLEKFQDRLYKYNYAEQVNITFSFVSDPTITYTTDGTVKVTLH